MKVSTPSKIVITLGVLLSTTALFSSSTYENSPRCEKKIHNIQEQLNIAKQMNNTHRVDGLKISLSKVKKYCSDKDLIQDIKDKIKEAKEDLNEYKQDHQKAIKENRADKIQKYQSKIYEENEKIQRLQEELEG